MRLVKTISSVVPRLQGGSFLATVNLAGPDGAVSDVRVPAATLYDYDAFRREVFEQSGDIFSPFDDPTDPTPGQWLKMIESWAFRGTIAVAPEQG